MRQTDYNNGFSEDDLTVIDHLSDAAKQRFRLLSFVDQKRMLRKARLLNKQEEAKKKGKEKNRNRKAKIKKESKEETEEKRIRTVTEKAESLLTSKQSKAVMGRDPAINRVEKDVPDNMRKGNTETRASMRNSLQKGMKKEYFIQRNRKKGISGVKQDTKHFAKSSTKISKALKRFSCVMVKMIKLLLSSPVLWGLLFVVILIVLLVAVISLFLGSSGGAGSGAESSSYQAQVSEQTENYRGLVETYCNKYRIEDYVDLCLAVIQQESGGNGKDVMQAEQSYHNTDPPIDTPEESIDCGVHELSDCLKSSGSKSSGDIPLISLALQGYNFGNGYIAWAKENYGGYSLDNAKTFSAKMCSSLGLKRYGDVEYVPHVLRYYVPNGNTKVTDKKAAALIKELKENNKAEPAVWKVIEKGASLTGNVTYGMLKPPRQDDGRDNPNVLDCSSFVAWSFHKSGYTGVPYASTTKTFIDAGNFVTVNADSLQVGDIGLKSETAPTGGANHVGIYCGKLKNGTKVWLHCTSSSGTSFTGNTTGVMMGAYTNFTFFRRLSKWNKEDS